MSVVFRANMTGKAKFLQNIIQVHDGKGYNADKSAIEDDISDEAFDDKFHQVLNSQEHLQRHML